MVDRPNAKPIGTPAVMHRPIISTKKTTRFRLPIAVSDGPASPSRPAIAATGSTATTRSRAVPCRITCNPAVSSISARPTRIAPTRQLYGMPRLGMVAKLSSST